MSDAFRSPWLIVHVVFAWLAFGCFAIAAGASLLLLLKARKPDSLRLPDPARMDLANYRYLVLGFVNHAVMLLAGAIWAKLLWGHYWSWDPLETWSAVAFLFYAFALHARTFLHWQGSRAAWLTLAGFVVLSISFWGVSVFSPNPMHPGP